jgi:PAS domain S-box-containing protein
MEISREHSAEEIKRLQRCVNDLVSILALPAMWTGGEPARLVGTLLDALKGMLRLDFVYLRLSDSFGEPPIEMIRGAQSLNLSSRPHEIGELINNWLGNDAMQLPPVLRGRVGEKDFSIVPLRMGLQGEIGVLVAGSHRADFPGETERLALSVAANEAVIGLQEARLLSEQRRVASELDLRVAERTRELAEINEELQIQVGLLQHIPVAAWTLRSDGTPDFVNQVWLEYTGQTLDFIRSHPEAWMTAVHPEDRDAASKCFWNGVHSGRGFVMEARFLRARDGIYRWHLNRAVVLRNAEGEVLRFVGTSTDIEDVKRSEENLRRAEEKTRLIIDTALDAVITMDAQGTITSWNKQAEVVFQWSNREAIGQHMPEMIIPERRRAAHERGLLLFLATGNGPILGRRIEVTAVRRSGVEFPAELEIVPMKLGPDWVFSAFVRDISESKQAEEKLRRSEAFLAEGQRLDMTGSFSWRLDTDEITFSEQLYRIFELEHDVPVTPELISSRVHAEDIPLLSVKIDGARTGSSDLSCDIRLRMPTGSIKYLRTVAHRTQDRDGRLEIIGAVQDVTERRLSEDALSKVRSELAHMTRAASLGALTASIAHEVNQPLSGIVTNASTCLRMLAANPPNVDGALETARRTIRDGKRASEVIARLRALFGKKDEVTEPVDLNEAAQEVIALSFSDLQRNRVILRSEFADKLPAVTGDRIQLQQVILNLLLNASEAMSGIDDRPRQLLIRTECDHENCVRLSVQDAGVGIDPQNLDKLFDAFYTTKSAGMGMGLCVSRTILENHHGRLWATRNDGPGSTFSFSIPYKSEVVVENQNIGSTEAPAEAGAANLMRKS